MRFWEEDLIGPLVSNSYIGDNVLIKGPKNYYLTLEENKYPLITLNTNKDESVYT